MKQTLKRLFPFLISLRDWYRTIGKKQRELKLAGMSQDQIFQEYYHSNQWGDQESRSGDGSNLAATKAVREKLPVLLSENNIQSLADIPCGDFNWMKTVPLDDIDYIGGDIVPEIIEANTRSYGTKNRNFQITNICNSSLPKVDMILCRDALVHLSNSDILKAVKNIKLSGSRYLLTTTFVDMEENKDIVTGMWRPINLLNEPFNFPVPDKLISEEFAGQGGRYTDKSLALWEIDKLP